MDLQDESYVFFPKNIGIRHVLLDCASSGQLGHCRWLPKSSWRAWFSALSRASSFSKTTLKLNIENPHVWSPTPNKDIRKHPKTINTSWRACFVFYRSSKFQNSTFHFSSSISDLKRSISMDHHAHVLISIIQVSSLIFSSSLFSLNFYRVILNLVGGLEHLDFVSIYWECHHPNWRTHIFQRGRYTTNQSLYYITSYYVYDPIYDILTYIYGNDI